MAKVTGPLFSLSASGTVGKVVTYGTWKGICWAREWFKPSNPQSASQTNVRKAWNLAVAEWTDTLTEAQTDSFDDGAEGTAMSGFNLYMKRAMNGYIEDLGSSADPLSIVTTGNYPSDSMVWTEVT